MIYLQKSPGAVARLFHLSRTREPSLPATKLSIPSYPSSWIRLYCRRPLSSSVRPLTHPFNPPPTHPSHSSPSGSLPRLRTHVP
ncbi:hypothetical protein K523DRAFT_108574 [Schizophyllum commune Tattone D]|nr:hypothetical protein K523DRAFT_108574 [Schizophyllum commune Tattone D]